jgi:hypothetical protein
MVVCNRNGCIVYLLLFYNLYLIIDIVTLFVSCSILNFMYDRGYFLHCFLGLLKLCGIRNSCLIISVQFLDENLKLNVYFSWFACINLPVPLFLIISALRPLCSSKQWKFVPLVYGVKQQETQPCVCLVS